VSAADDGRILTAACIGGHLITTLSEQHLETTVVLGPHHTATLRDLLPYAGW